MKRKITLSIALVLSIIFVSLTSSDSTVKAQQQTRFRADTGFVTLGQGQILRVTVTGAEVHNDGEIYAIRFIQMNYTQDTCGGGVCKLTISSQSTTNPIPLMTNEALSYDLGDTTTHEVRGVVLSNSRDAQVNASIIDAATGKTEVFENIPWL